MITRSAFGEVFEFDEVDITVLDEIFNDNYKVIEKGVPFERDDVIIDIGANIGMFSILFAKLHPYIKVYAFEPVAETYLKMCKNIKLNNITNITPVNTAVSGGKRIEHIIYHPQGLGGASSYVKTVKEEDGVISTNVGCITLDEILLEFNIEKCKLMKIDCEGAEYDIIYNSKLLSRINYIVGEFHENSALQAAGHSWTKLAAYCASKVEHMLYFEWCEMYE